MILRLPYGKGTLTADLRGLRCRVLAPSCPRHAPPIAELASVALDRPVATPPLVELARGRRRVTILVPDATRKASLPIVLPRVLERLARAGVADGAIEVLVACGTHPPVDAATLAALVGPMPAGVRVSQHDAGADDELVAVGRSARGQVIRLNRRAVECDLLVAVSAVQHHYFAGFGGGPKMVFPGVAGEEETQANHALVIDLSAAPPRRRPGCEPGWLDGNPVAEEIRAAAALRPVDVLLALVNDVEGSPCWASGGAPEPVFAAACGRVRAWYEVEGSACPRVIVTGGGYPTDRTLIQAHKALDAACRFAAPGAEVLWIARCDGGAGSAAMEPFLADPRPEAILARLAERYVQYGHTALRLAEKTTLFDVRAVTDLDADLVARLGMVGVDSPQEVLDRWRREDPGSTVAVMPGAVVYPRACSSPPSSESRTARTGEASTPTRRSGSATRV
jgi:lactate racemase